jgi:hypothetical protein
MNALRLVLVLSVLSLFAGCATHSPEACQAACAKGVPLAKAALTDATKELSADAQAEALAEWKAQEAGLKASLTQCEERCTRDPNPELVTCLEAAKSLQSYTGCLR